jgi:glycosyltransferase involved in cell wall biosynthesis
VPRPDEPDRPLLSIGIPTYNREATLPRAIESALGQTYEHLELVISDNASTDGTERICRSYADRDPRVRYLRRPRNDGPTENFNGLFERCAGAFVMMLADDDWVDADYAERCLATLQSSPAHVLVAGRARYYRDDAEVNHGVALNLEADDPAARTRAYYASVEDNGTFYGLIRREALRAAAPMPNVLGNDWLLIGRIAFLGKVRTLDSTSVHRELGGTSVDIETILQTFRAPSFQARVPHLYIARAVFADIAHGSPIFRELPPAQRVVLGLKCAWHAIDWASLAWHLSAPTAAAIGRRRGLGWVWRGYDRVTRALGAGDGP